jgi:hypothetical protein
VDVQETFNNLRKYTMMLNPTKCIFGVPVGQFLGFIVSHRGIEVNPEKIKAILDISRPNDLKDVHRLTGCMAAVSRFISHLGEKALPLYKLIKMSDEFIWTDEADAALKDLKRVLSPRSSRRRAHVTLHGSNQQDRQHRHHGRTQGRSTGVWRTKTSLYVSEVLTKSKQRYPHYQKLAYGVFLASHKLRCYFYDHRITVVSKAPLKDIINNSDAIGRVAKWGIELATFNIDYKPRTAIKSQALAEFMADWKEAQETTLVP